MLILIKKVQSIFDTKESSCEYLCSIITMKNTYAMKKLVISLVLCLVLPFTLTAQKKSIQSFLSYTTYFVPDDKPFIENALAFDCSSVVYQQFEPGQFKATVEIQTIFKQDEKVCNFSKIALDSPVVTDTTNVKGAFIDQQRFSLDNGKYLMEITIKDLNKGLQAWMEKKGDDSFHSKEYGQVHLLPQMRDYVQRLPDRWSSRNCG